MIAPEKSMINSHPNLARLQTPRGRYAMLALDQRESLRGMFETSPLSQGGSDSDLRDFKLAATKLLTPSASGILLDRLYALDPQSLEAIDPQCGLIVAVDHLLQESGFPVRTTLLDSGASVEFLHTVGADAVKFLVMWKSPKGKAERAQLVESVVELANKAGVATLIEAVVLPEEGAHWSNPNHRNDAIMAAAEEMAALPMDLYKAQVPGYSPGNLSEIETAARELDRIIRRPWVVLSNGVEIDDFPEAVEQACSGGASGFLAGRAIWSDLVGATELDDALVTIARPRLEKLANLVDSL